MAELTFISETGMFHSAVRGTWGKHVEWYGFKPKAHMTPAGAGFVDRSDRTKQINHSVTFHLSDGLLHAALKAATAKYHAKFYVVTVCDCVSYTADVARLIHLKVAKVNITPYGLIETLAAWNTHLSKT